MSAWMTNTSTRGWPTSQGDCALTAPREPDPPHPSADPNGRPIPASARNGSRRGMRNAGLGRRGTRQRGIPSPPSLRGGWLGLSLWELVSIRPDTRPGMATRDPRPISVGQRTWNIRSLTQNPLRRVPRYPPDPSVAAGVDLGLPPKPRTGRPAIIEGPASAVPDLMTQTSARLAPIRLRLDR
jgi:hypothetical protein